jgi:hypothetical protein
MATEKKLEGNVPSLAEVERDAIQILEPELRKHGLLNESVFNTIGEAANLAAEIPLSQVSQARKVATVLLLRIRDDLRCASLLALRGYQLQACILVASIYETAFTIAAIDSDDDLAQAWIDHDDPNKSFKDALLLTEMALCKLGIPEPKKHADREYLVYRQLCLVKHLNPVFQRQRGLKLLGRQVTVNSGPDTSEEGIREAWFALERAAALACVATASFVQHHVPAKSRAGLNEKLKGIEMDVLSLSAKAQQRWGTEPPFEKWKIVL